MSALSYRPIVVVFLFVSCLSSSIAQSGNTYYAVVGKGSANRDYAHSGEYYNCGDSGPFYQEDNSVIQVTLSF